jgi:bifunctional UDP-N-acetylglucosamine pyrophosphorylase/glucosamine-1-phosphate N-acetyltransferase
MLKGVTMMDPHTTYIDAQVLLDRDVQIWPNTFVLGDTRIGENSQIGPNTVVRNSIVGSRCQINASLLEESTLEDAVKIGPYAHLREHTYVERDTYIGNFAEVKNSHLGRDVKMGHFSYVGDATIGTGTNIGAGTITCNYDGENKHYTEIGEHAFIGSGTMLVAPVRIGSRSRTGAGSVVTKDVPDGVSVFGVPARVNSREDEGENQ